MNFRVTAAGLSILVSVLLAPQASAVDLPAVKVSSSNKVLSCVTPGRLMAFLKTRNDKLDARFSEIASDYMRYGEELNMRWDYAFFQMLLETGNLKFGGDVKPAQNNFAGLGATGNGERGESFKDVPTGVRAHLEHLIMYTGEKVANPVAERTRKVQEWGVLTEWQKTLKGPLTFAQLAKKWAPPARKYALEIEQVAENFADGPCKASDPQPELVAAVRAGKSGAKDAAKAVPAPDVAAAPVTDVATPGIELAKRANDDARAEGTGKRSALGAGGVAKAAAADAKAAQAKAGDRKAGDRKAGDDKAKPYALLNAPKPELDPAVTAKPAEAAMPSVTKVAAGSAAKGAKPVAVACKVFQASYGGAKTVIIKAVANDVTQYTVLDVNEGSEAREADAYIAAYAPGGKQVGEFKTQNMALDKAFELCPEG
ncbi:MAG: hypothetical protein ABL901_18405 [Hyphomicrobiaceae bacterium]